jgi:hypothetical protein
MLNVLSVAMTLAAAPAPAALGPFSQEVEVIGEDDEKPNVVIVDDDDEDEGPGASLSAGGGVFGFTNETVQDATTDVGAAYQARLHLGTNTPLGFELAYIGTAQNLDALGVEDDAFLVSNGGEAGLTLGIPIFNMIHPYAYGGAAWKRYDVVNTDTNTSAVADDDDVFELPLGGGLMWDIGQVILDARGVYRWAFEEDLIAGGDEGLDNWDVTLRAGMEF